MGSLGSGRGCFLFLDEDEISLQHQLLPKLQIHLTILISHLISGPDYYATAAMLTINQVTPQIVSSLPHGTRMLECTPLPQDRTLKKAIYQKKCVGGWTGVLLRLSAPRTYAENDSGEGREARRQPAAQGHHPGL